MYIVDINYDESFYTSNIFETYFGTANVGVFDIETTGLDPKRSKFVLGGLLTPAEGGVRVRQYFSEGGDEEVETLEAYREDLEECDILVSYNGNRFDVPFLDERLAKHHRRPLHNFLSFDLYRVLSKHSEFRKVLPNLKQKTVEEFLGLATARKDQISGGDSVYLYHEYVATKREELREFILLHNRDDVRQLAKLMRALDKLDLHRIVSDTGFPVISNGDTILVKNIRLSRKSLEISGRHSWTEHDHRYYIGDMVIEFYVDGNFYINIPCTNEAKSIYADIGDLDVEGSIGQYLILREKDTIDHSSINRLIKGVLLDIIKGKEGR